MDQSFPQLFGIIPTGLPPITTPTTTPSPTSYVYTLPTRNPPSQHICVFLLPGIALPPDTAAAVYISVSSPSNTNGEAPSFRFLGGIGPGKESAIFKISSPPRMNSIGGVEIDMDAPTPTTPIPSSVTIGISIESAASVSAQMASLSSSSSSNINSQSPSSSNSNALILARAQPQQMTTIILAQRIIKNAFNFLASFSGNLQNGVEVVPLKAFEEWWRKFEARVKNDPGFLERGDGV